MTITFTNLLTEERDDVRRRRDVVHEHEHEECHRQQQRDGEVDLLAARRRHDEHNGADHHEQRDWHCEVEDVELRSSLHDHEEGDVGEYLLEARELAAVGTTLHAHYVPLAVLVPLVLPDGHSRRDGTEDQRPSVSTPRPEHQRARLWMVHTRQCKIGVWPTRYPIMLFRRFSPSNERNIIIVRPYSVTF